MLVTQLCLTLCDPMDCSLPDSSAYGILQDGEFLEWIEYWEWIVITIPLSRGSSWPKGSSPSLLQLQADSLLYEAPAKFNVA